MNQEALSKRFDEEIERMELSPLELIGMRSNPLLAVKVGMARGYCLGMCACVSAIEEAIPKVKSNG